MKTKSAIDSRREICRQRLVKGQAWLVEHWARWPDPAMANDQLFGEAFWVWVDLEKEIRVLGYEGCVIGPGGCHPTAPVVCDACVAPNSDQPIESSKQFALS